MRRHHLITCITLALAAGCQKEVPPPLYEPVAVARRDIVVAAEAAGSVEPILVVDVKSKASGEIMDLRAETGDVVRQGELLVAVDPREPRNSVAQAEADLQVARSQLANAEAQKNRMDAMFRQQLVSEQEHEQASLAHANAVAQQVRAERTLQTARDQLDDTQVRAPITGTIISKSVERGQVITSATREVSGGTVLMRMADLSNVQVRTLVDETDIGKIQPGMRATVRVDAYPNQPFTGEVLKIEPQSVVTQNVTMFPVLIRIANADGRLRPGMNAQVELHIGQRPNVLAIPNAALRTQRDVNSAAQVLGLNVQEVQATLARADSAAPQQTTMGGTTNGGSRDRGAGGSRPDSAKAPAAAPTVTPGAAPLDMDAVKAAFQKRMSGATLTPQETALLARAREQMQRSGGGASGRRPQASSFQFGGRYIVFVLRDGQPTPVRVQTGMTDMDYSEVVSGLTERDTVLLLPSASLVASQAEMRERFQRMGGGGVPGMQQQPAGATKAPQPR